MAGDCNTSFSLTWRDFHSVRNSVGTTWVTLLAWRRLLLCLALAASYTPKGANRQIAVLIMSMYLSPLDKVEVVDDANEDGNDEDEEIFSNDGNYSN